MLKLFSTLCLCILVSFSGYSQDLNTCEVNNSNDGESQDDFAVWLFSGPHMDSYYFDEPGVFIQNFDGTAQLTGSATGVETGKIIDLQVNFENRSTWSEWSAMGRGYKDSPVTGDNYLDYLYYEISSTSTITVNGGADVLTLTHSPVNYFYGFQVGIGANGFTSTPGLGGWFLYSGTEGDGQGDFLMEGTCPYVDPVGGCTDLTACNYDVAAIADDGTCIQATGCDECSGETDGTGTVIENPDIGDPCDDGDAATGNDMIGTDCICAGIEPGTSIDLPIDISAGGIFNSGLIDGEFDPSVGSCFGSSPDAYNWYSYTATSTGLLTVSSFGIGGTDSQVAVATGDSNGLSEIACNDDIGGAPFESEITFQVTEGSTYYVVWGNGWDANPFDFEVTLNDIIAGCTDNTACNYNQAANLDDSSCSYAEGCDTCSGETDGSGTVVMGSLDGTTCDSATPIAEGIFSNDPLCGDGASNGCYTGATSAAWYAYTATLTGTATVNSSGSVGLPDTRVSIHTGTCEALVCLASDDDAGDANTSLVTFEASAGETYLIEWDDRWNSNAFSFEVSIEALVSGCMDVAACNYNAAAETNDASCVYAEEACDTCSGETDGTGTVIDNPEIGETCNDQDPDTDNDVVTDCDGTCAGTLIDTDGDGVTDSADNCPADSNANQADADSDGLGDACDSCPLDANNDIDGDGVCGDVDNCADLANSEQADLDGDLIGDACDDDIDGDGVANADDCAPMDTALFEGATCSDGDPTTVNDAINADCICEGTPTGTDTDGDGVNDDVDNCPADANADQENADGDSLGDACDNCPDEDNEDQANEDGDSLGNACDNCPNEDNEDQANNDSDSLGDACDNCPNDDNQDQADLDSDGLGDACDDDIDGDGVANADDCAPMDAALFEGATCDDGNPNTSPDAINSNCDCEGVLIDADADGVTDSEDNCPTTPNTDQANDDGDTFGNACDNCPNDDNEDQANADGDTLGDTCDNCPNDDNEDQADLDADDIGDACDSDIDGDGVDNADDCAPMDAEVFEGATCDDGDEATEGDVILEDCTCAGIISPPANDLCSDATVLTCGSELIGETTVGSTNQNADVTCGMGSGVWYTIVGTGDDITVAISNDAFDVEVAVESGDCNNLTNVSCTDAGTSSESTSFSSVLGTNYYIYVGDFSTDGSDAGTFDIALTCVAPPVAPANDLCINAILLECNDALIGESTVGSTSQNDDLACGIGSGVWYSIAGTGGDITIDVTNTDFDVELAVESGDCSALTNVSCTDIGGANAGESTTFSSLLGTNYFIYVGYFSTFTDDEGTFDISATCAVPPACTAAVVESSEIVADCPNSEFSVLVTFTSEGDATGVSDGTNTYPIAGGEATAGPFATGTTASLSVVHGDLDCDFDLGDFEYDDCPIIIDCDAAPLANEFCYENNDLFNISYASSDPVSELTITFSAGYLEESTTTGNSWDDIIIYDGTDVNGTVLYNSNDGIIGNDDLAGLTFVGTSGNLFFTFDADGSVSCSSIPETPIAYTVECTVPLDSDADGVSDAIDNCPNTPNPDQTDMDEDGLGAACECDDNSAAITDQAGDACDDLDNNTYNDVSDCVTCAGTPCSSSTIGVLSTDNPGPNCAADGLADVSIFTLADINASNVALLIVTPDGSLANAGDGTALFPVGTGGINFEGALGDWTVYAIGFEDNLGGALAGATLADLTGCVALSNPIVITGFDNGENGCEAPSAPSNDAICDAIALDPLTCDGSTVTSTNMLATPDGGAGSCWDESGIGADVWYTLIVPASGSVYIESIAIVAGYNDTQFTLYSSDGDCTGTLTEVACDEDIDLSGGDYMSIISTNGLTPGEMLYLQIDGYGSWQGTFDLFTSDVCPTLSIEGPPQAIVACDNGSINPSETGMATAAGDCENITVAYLDGVLAGDCPKTLMRTWIATDGCGASVSCVQEILILDESTPDQCPSDITGDNVVDVSDFVAMNSMFGSTCTGCAADLNNDGMVDISDFLILNSNYGAECELVSAAQNLSSTGLNAGILEDIINSGIDNVNPDLMKAMLDMSISIDFSISPNPNAGDQFQLELSGDIDELSSATIDIFDMTGRKVYSRNQVAASTRMLVTTDVQLGSGLYLVSMTIDGIAVTKRMIVE